MMIFTSPKAFEMQLSEMRTELAEARREENEARAELEELYDELQLAHDQLSLCKLRIEQRNVLEDDMQHTISNLKHFSRTG